MAVAEVQGTFVLIILFPLRRDLLLGLNYNVKFMKRAFLIFCTAIMAFSCGNSEKRLVSHVCFIEKTVADTSLRSYKAINTYDNSINSGVISVIGPIEETVLFSESLLQLDFFDNIDGKKAPDGLPDFAGETISLLLDAADEPYSGYFNEMNENFISEIAAKASVFAISDSCCSSPFDRKNLQEKKRAKIIVLASSYFSKYGYNDVKALFRHFGKDIEVISPVQSSVSHVLDNCKDIRNIGVWADIDVISSGVYSEVYKTMTEASGIEETECVCLSASMEGTARDKVMRYLNMYSYAGYDSPLSAVIVDALDCADSLDAMNAAAREIMTAEDSSLTGYKNLLGQGFSFVSPKNTMAEDCYMYLRKSNRFTHRIAYPAAEGFVAVPSADVQNNHIGEYGFFSDEFKYTRAAGSDIETVCIIPASHRYLTQEHLHSINVLAPEISKQLFYVY